MNPDLLVLALRHVRTPEGVRKYRQPIGSIIRPDLVPSVRDHFDPTSLWGDRQPEIDKAAKLISLEQIRKMTANKYTAQNLIDAPPGTRLETPVHRGGKLKMLVIEKSVSLVGNRDVWRSEGITKEFSPMDLAHGLNTGTITNPDENIVPTSHAVGEVDLDSALGRKLSEVYSFKHPLKDGGMLEIVLTDAWVGERLGEPTVSTDAKVTMHFPDGTSVAVGRVQRSLSGKEAENSLFKIKNVAQKKGLATAYNRHLENWYIANGVESVKLSAGLSTGGYAWARDGFDWEAGSYPPIEAWLDEARQLVQGDKHPEYTEEMRQADLIEIADLYDRISDLDYDDEDYPTPWEISQIGARFPEEEEDGTLTWPGKYVLLGKTWEGRKDLRPDEVQPENTVPEKIRKVVPSRKPMKLPGLEPDQKFEHYRADGTVDMGMNITSDGGGVLWSLADGVKDLHWTEVENWYRVQYPRMQSAPVTGSGWFRMNAPESDIPAKPTEGIWDFYSVEGVRFGTLTVYPNLRAFYERADGVSSTKMDQPTAEEFWREHRAILGRMRRRQVTIEDLQAILDREA